MTTSTVPPEKIRSQMSRKSRLAERGIDGTLWLLVPAVLVIVALFLYPFIYGISLSFQPLEGASPFSNYTEFFTDPYMLDSIWKTVRLAIPVAVTSVAIAAPIAYQARRNFRGRGMIVLLLMLPLTFGSILIAQGMSLVFALFGWINLGLEALGLPPGDFLYNYTGTFIAGVFYDAAVFLSPAADGLFRRNRPHIGTGGRGVRRIPAVPLLADQSRRWPCPDWSPR